MKSVPFVFVACAQETTNLVYVDSRSVIRTKINGGRIFEPLPDSSPMPLLFEYIGETDGWVHIRTTQTEDAFNALSWINNYAIDLVVSRSDLIPVLTEPFVQTHATGLRTIILPGQPLVNTLTGTFKFALVDWKDLESVPSHAVGTKFSLQTIESHLNTKEIRICTLDYGTLDPNKGCWMYEKNMGVSSVGVAYPVYVGETFHTAFIQKSFGRFDEVMVQKPSAHAETTPKYPEWMGTTMLDLLASNQHDEDAMEVAAGTIVLWSDGTKAGEVRTATTVTVSSTLTSKQNDNCTELKQPALYSFEHKWGFDASVELSKSYSNIGFSPIAICFQQKSTSSNELPEVESH